MGDVLLVYEIRPESVDVTPKKLEEEIRNGLDQNSRCKIILKKSHCFLVWLV